MILLNKKHTKQIFTARMTFLQKKGVKFSYLPPVKQAVNRHFFSKAILNYYLLKP